MPDGVRQAPHSRCSAATVHQPVTDRHACERRQYPGGVHRSLSAPRIEAISRVFVGGGHLEPPQLAFDPTPASSKCATWAWASSLYSRGAHGVDDDRCRRSVQHDDFKDDCHVVRADHHREAVIELEDPDRVGVRAEHVLVIAPVCVLSSITVILRSFLPNQTVLLPGANLFTASRNRDPIFSMIAGDGIGNPRSSRYCTSCPPTCRCGTYPLR